jgi:hypothetical protein
MCTVARILQQQRVAEIFHWGGQCGVQVKWQVKPQVLVYAQRLPEEAIRCRVDDFYCPRRQTAHTITVRVKTSVSMAATMSKLEASLGKKAVDGVVTRV